MSSRSSQPAKQPVFQGLIKKNANVPFIFLNDEFLMKLSPLCRVSDIKKEIDSLIATGDTERLGKFITTVFDNPNVIYIDGIAYVMNTVMPTSAIESRLDTEVVRRIQERDQQNSDKDIKEMLNYVVTLLHSQQKTSDGEVITAMDYAREGISFAILKAGVSGEERLSLYATKYVPSYRIRYQSVDPNPTERRRKSGVWQFPECMIAAKIIKIAKSPGDRDWKIGLERAASIVHPNNYQNMYVFHGNGICTSPMSGTATEQKIMGLDFISACFFFLKQVEFIITKGYHEKSSPAAGHLADAQYDKFRVKKNGSDFVTCSTCPQSGRCHSSCEAITLDEESSAWVEHQKHMAENEVAGSLEATRGVTRKIRDRD
jgi:hypothetical protein